MKLLCNAKINLALRVGRKRPDGFHDIESVFHSVTLNDTVTLESGPGSEISLAVEGASLLGDTDNTMYRAALALQDRADVQRSVSMNLRKVIPIGAGLGGGSADAAAVLVGLNQLWDIGMTVEELQNVGAEIGSDVPYCVSGGPMLVTGRGESLNPIPAPVPLWLVLGISDDPLSTAAIYSRWDELDLEPGPSPAPLASALGAGDIAGVADALHNDLESAAFSVRPELAGKKDALRSAGALGALMSGSGPTVMGLCEGEPDARAVARRVATTFDRVEVVCTASSCVTAG